MTKPVGLLSLLAVCLLPLPAVAEPAGPPWFSVETTVGLNMFFPFAQLKLGLRPPGMDHWEFFIAHAPLNFSDTSGVFPQSSLVGAKYYLLPAGNWQPFFTASLASFYRIPDGHPFSSWENMVLMGGFGGDWMLTPHFGFSTAINATMPPSLRPEASLRFCW